MDFVIDFSQIASNPLEFIWWFFKTIGWIIPVIFFIAGLLKFWQLLLRNKYRASRKYIILAIDVPKDNLQGPKAVENIFNHLAGAHQPLTWYEKWWTGEIKDSFSFEIVSIGGYIQFMIHLPAHRRDLVEAILYAQYPDAEITEIEDYTKSWNYKFPSDTHQLWGVETKFVKKDFYPIRTYPEFEDSTSKEAYKDSMASLLEVLSRIGPGEQIGVQFVVSPADNDWTKDAQKLIDKIIGAKSKPSGFDPVAALGKAVGYVVGSALDPVGATLSSGDDDSPNQLLYMTDGEKEVLKGIERKITKIGFHCRTRLIYIAEKDKFRSSLSSAIYGSFKQFNTVNLNSLRPNMAYLTGGIILFKQLRLKWRRNKMLFLYKSRGHWLDPEGLGQYYNSEEMATLWHFPTSVVKTPLVQKADTKKAEPPISLPHEAFPGAQSIPVSDENKGVGDQSIHAEPPSNLPIG